MTGSHPPLSAPASRRELTARIERLAVSADAKALLAQLLATTAQIGGRIVEVGRQIVHFAFETLKRFPNAAFGVIVGVAMSMLVGSVPVLGLILGPLLGPLLVAFGLGMGAIADMRDGAIGARVRLLEAEFRAMSHG